MNSFLHLLIVLSSAVSFCEGLRCWNCENANSNAECLNKGRLETCLPSQNLCQNEIRSISGNLYFKITKRCKQDRGCDSNRRQNHLATKSYNCERNNVESVCWCCCDTDNCNGPHVYCLQDKPKCEMPIPPVNGIYSCNNYKFEVGTNCIYRCRTGFKAVGTRAKTSTCVRTGAKAVWSSSALICEPITCDATPRTPLHGTMSCDAGADLYSTCVFACDENYVMVGSETAICNHFGKWDQVEPRCVQATCRTLTRRDRNLITRCSNENKVDTVCSFRCRRGFNIVGRRRISCGTPIVRGMGSWSGASPKCVVSGCKRPAGSKLLPSDCSDGFNPGSICGHKCSEEEYMTSGDGTGVISSGVFDIECLSDKTWNKPIPTCRPIVCPSLIPRFLNGNRRCTRGNRLGSECQFSCDSQFRLNGPASMTCSKGIDPVLGKWSVAEPRCIESICPQLVMKGGIVVTCDEGNILGSACHFRCADETHELTGATAAICIDSSLGPVWDLADVPSCQSPVSESCAEEDLSVAGSVVCRPLDNSNGTHWSVGTVCSLQCGDGKGPLNGMGNIACAEGEVWTNQEACCSDCKLNPSFDVAVLMDSSYVDADLWDVFKTFNMDFALYLTENKGYNLNFIIVPFATEVDSGINTVTARDITSDNYETLEDLVAPIPFGNLGSDSNSGQALQWVNTVIFEQLPENRVPIVLLLTTRSPSDQELALAAAQELRDRGIHLRIVPLVDFFFADAGTNRTIFETLTGGQEFAVVEEDSVEIFFETTTLGIDDVSLNFCNSPTQRCDGEVESE